MAGACVKLAANLLLFVLVLLGSVVLGQDLRPAPIETPHATEPHNILRPAEWTVAENLVPALSFTKLCQSHLSLTNLRDTPVKIEVEGHAQAGGLAPLIGHGSRVWIKPGETLQYSLQLEGDNEGAWIRVRERITSPDQGPAIAVRATTGCLEGETLVTRSREAAVPLRNPWFSGRVAELTGVTLWAVNISRSQAHLDACYSSGSYYIIPGETPKDATPVPICSHQDGFLLAPGAALRIPVAKDGNSEFSLHTEGDAILLQALRSEVTGTHRFSVDSAITFQSAP
jgi:hypothetical protein